MIKWLVIIATILVVGIFEEERRRRGWFTPYEKRVKKEQMEKENTDK